MQTDTIMRAGSESEDDDSLFGSPPPSPTRGRSPALALPSGSGTSSAQNVGTIALPGSHPYSELPVNPLALSLSVHSDHSRPPAQEQPLFVPVSVQPPTRSPPLSSRAPSTVPIRQKKTGKGRSATSSRSTTPRPALPMILPDPDMPPPPNFLRNQQALLGLAGMVGGVNPAHLSVHRRSRGATSANPIIIEDDLDPPPLGKKTCAPPVDLAQLPPPSNEDIVASLIKQKNIFPVLESILKLIAAGPSRNHSPTGFERRNVNDSENLDEPLAKRRKIRKVPAGATDWDVPYPFSEGEGPRGYGTNWERERGKQLIAQLVGLLKGAARKAATKAYVKQDKQPSSKEETTLEPNVRGHYRPATLTYGLEGAHMQTVLADNSNVHANASPPLSSLDSGTQQQPPTAFDQLVSDFLTSQNFDDVKQDEVGSSTSPDVSPSECSTQGYDQGLFDSWMQILHTFPSPEGAEGLGQIPSTTGLKALRQTQNPDLPSTNETSIGSRQSSSPDTNISLQSRDVFTDLVIDPALLAISMSPCQSAFTPTPSPLVASPMLSTSSLADPLTPNWGEAEPEVYTPDPEMTAEDPLTAATMLLQLASSSSSRQESEPSPKIAIPSSADVPLDNLQPSLLSTATTRASTTPSAAAEAPQTGRFNRIVAGPGRPNSKPSMKEGILRRARERRRQLAAEIERAKVELWETTIEQGVLVQMVKDISGTVVTHQ